MKLKHLFCAFTPLIQNKNFRYLFLGQLISYFGTMLSITVIPFHVYTLTQSSAMVGWISVIELLPLLLASVFGGVVTDHVNRKKLLAICEISLLIGTFILMLNSMRQEPSLLMIFIISPLLQVFNGFHRPALDSLYQTILTKKEIPLAAALSSFRYGLCALLGPSLGGLCMAQWGAPIAYAMNGITFGISIFCVLKLRISHRVQKTIRFSQILSSLKEGIRYASKRQELLGTYVIDFASMFFAFPVALFPALSLQYSQTSHSIGYFYSALLGGGLLIPLFGSLIQKTIHPGRMVYLSALFWGLGITAFGLSQNFYMAFICLAIAGFADALSGVFRGMIWNQTIPNSIRGRMSTLEIISYTSGPLLGNARAGWMASLSTPSISLIIGGLSCMIVVYSLGFFLPKFKNFQISQR